jgi:hypothetical protein
VADCDFEIDPAGLGAVDAALVDAAEQFSTGAETLRSLGDYLGPSSGGPSGDGEDSLGPALATAALAWHRTVRRLAESAVDLSTAVGVTGTLYTEADTATAGEFGTTGG